MPQISTSFTLPSAADLVFQWVMSADAFTLKRLCKFVADHRATKGMMPTLQDLDDAGFSKEVVQTAVKKKLIKELYSDMTSGAVVKVYKINDDGGI